MRPRLTLSAAVAVLPIVVAVVVASAPAGAAPSCQARKEQAGCVLKNAAYAAGDARFGVILGKGEASAAGTVSCSATDGSSGTSNVLYGSYPELAVKRPKIGKTYKRTLPLKPDPSRGFYNEGQVVLTVQLISAKRARITYVQDYKSTVQTATGSCHGRTSALLKRVS